MEYPEAMELLFTSLGEDEHGMPTPSRDRLAYLLEEARWDVRARTENGWLHVAVSLVDGDPKTVMVDLTCNQPEGNGGMALLTNHRFIGPAFDAYVRSFEQSAGEDSGPIGGLWLELEVPGHGETQLGSAPRRTAHLVLRQG